MGLLSAIANPEDILCSHAVAGTFGALAVAGCGVAKGFRPVDQIDQGAFAPPPDLVAPWPGVRAARRSVRSEGFLDISKKSPTSFRGGHFDIIEEEQAELEEASLAQSEADNVDLSIQETVEEAQEAAERALQ